MAYAAGRRLFQNVTEVLQQDPLLTKPVKLHSLSPTPFMGRCERVLHSMGREVNGRTKIKNESCQMAGREVTR